MATALDKMEIATMEKDELLYMAQTCELTERFDDMVIFIKKQISFGPAELNAEEESLFNNAFRQSVIPRKNSLKSLCDAKEIEEKKGECNLEKLNESIKQIEKELITLCKDCIDLIDANLLKFSSKPESKVFLLKMKGDYNRYLTEFCTGEIFKIACDLAISSQKEGMEISKHLKPNNPLKLAIALNAGVFYHEILRDPHKAFEIGNQATSESIKGSLDVEPDKKEEYKSTLEILNENLVIWGEEVKKKEEETEKKSDSDEKEEKNQKKEEEKKE